MTPLIKLIEGYSGEWKFGGDQDQIREELLIDGVALLSNLCEGSSLALEVFNKNKAGSTFEHLCLPF